MTGKRWIDIEKVTLCNNFMFWEDRCMSLDNVLLSLMYILECHSYLFEERYKSEREMECHGKTDRA